MALPRKGNTVEYHCEGGEAWMVAIIAEMNDDDTANLTVLLPEGQTRPALCVPWKDNADDGVPFYKAM
jgi:hypothetical protein